MLEEFFDSLRDEKSSLEAAVALIGEAEWHCGQLQQYAEEIIAEGEPRRNEVIEFVQEITGKPASNDRFADSIPSELRGKRLNFLHLTDLHVGLDDHAHLYPQIFQELAEDVKWFIAQYGPVDVVFFTGDMVQSGTKKQFKRLNQKLTDLWDLMQREGGSWPVLLAVPGNHDLIMGKSQMKRNMAARLKEWHSSEPTRREVLEESSSPLRRFVNDAFKPFQEWWSSAAQFKNGILEERAGILPGDCAWTVEANGIQLGVVGLNSAFVQIADVRQPGLNALSSKQLHGACAGNSKDGGAPQWCERHDVVVLLTHHPPNWLHERSRQDFDGEIHVPNRFLFHLCGHVHSPEFFLTSHGGAVPCYTMLGRSLFGMEVWEDESGDMHERLHGYTAGQIVVGENYTAFRLVPRARRDNNAHAIACDVEGYDLVKGAQHTHFFRRDSHAT